MSAGVLNQKQVWELILGDSPRLLGYCNHHEGPGESAIDLPLGKDLWELSSSTRPSDKQTIEALLSENKAKHYELKSDEDFILKVGRVYIVQTPWRLKLPQNVRARATAKSSIGRLGALVRLLVDRHDQYDRVPPGHNPGHETKLYVEIIPTTFQIIVRRDMCLSQLRFVKGDPDLYVLASNKLIFEDQEVLYPGSTDADNRRDLTQEAHREGVLLGLNLTPDKTISKKGHSIIGFVAKQNARSLPPLDPTKKGPDSKGYYDPKRYWDAVTRESQSAEDQVLIQTDRFYIFRSLQRFSVPPHLAVECLAYSESLGDIRIHYAGFAHPFFGHKRKDKKNGTPLIFEVRGFTFDSTLRHNTPLARVQFWRMAEPAETGEMSYMNQELTLSNCFKQWPKLQSRDSYPPASVTRRGRRK